MNDKKDKQNVCKLQIKDFGEIVTGSTPPTALNKYWKGDFCFYSPSDFSDNTYCNKTEKTITLLGLKQGREIPINSVMVTCIASIGKLAINTKLGITNQQINTIIVNQNFDSKYIYYLLCKNIDQIKNSAAQTSVPIINKTDFGNIELFVNYNKKEQGHIAQILTTCDKVIEQTEAVIAKYKAIKQGMLHDLFTRGLDKNGKLRPTQTEAPELYKESELGLIPKEWEVKRLSECCKIQCSYGINAPAVDYDSKLPLYLRITDITEDGSYNKNGRKCVNSINSNQYILNEDDIVFARTGATVGKTYLYKTEDGKLVYAGFLIKFSPDPNLLNSYFLKSYTETPQYWDWVNIYSQRSGQPGINGNEYASLLLPYPTIDEQNQLAYRFTVIDINIKNEVNLFDKYKKIKLGLMNRLLTT